MRGADVGSDHSLPVNKTLRLRWAEFGDSKRQWFDVAKLKNPAVKVEFTVALRNQYCILKDDAALTINSLTEQWLFQ